MTTPDSTASSPRSPTHSRRRSKRTPPLSLPDHFARKGYLSVSDLVGPAWCEYNYQYGILSLSHLPPSLRPSTITTESGATLAPQPALVAAKQTTLDAGKAIHTLLERQVAPTQVVVETQTSQDAWALRLLNLWCDVMALIRSQPGTAGERERGKGKRCVREVAVYGWIHGVLVMGVIDEIEKRTITTPKGASRDKGKVWSSQEEWKKNRMRKASSSFSSTNGSPKKSKQSNAASTRPLTAFFGSSQSSSQPQQQQQQQRPTQPVEETANGAGWGYFLSDTKTRIASWLPAEEDQHSARMQCMTYKRLFDGLLLGALLSCPTSSSTDDIPISFDPNTTPMKWEETFASLALEPDQPLSAAFLRDAEPVCQSWGVELREWVKGVGGAEVCTLDHVRLLLEDGLRMLGQDAKSGAVGGGGREEEKVAVIQDTLALTYRRQTQRGQRGKRKKGAGARRSTRSTVMANGNKEGVRQTTLDPQMVAAKMQTGGEDPLVEEDLLEDELVDHDSQPLEGIASETQKKSLDALDLRNDAQHAIQETLSSPPLSLTPRHNHATSIPTSPTSPTAPSSTHPAEALPPRTTPPSPPSTSSSIIGVVSFPHDPRTLDAYLHRTIAMWKGQRALVGVAPEQTRRCWTCEWIEGCEWRAKQAERAAAVVVRRPQPSEAERAQIEVQTDGGGEGAERREQDDVQAGGDARGDAGEAGDDAEDFWSTVDYDSIQVRDASGNLVDW